MSPILDVSDVLVRIKNKVNKKKNYLNYKGVFYEGMQV